MNRRLLIFCLAWAPVLLLTGLAYADITTVPVTANAHADIAPHIHGNYIVWQGNVDGDWEIFLYNVATGQTTQITENDYDDFSPQTDGNNVVWVGYNVPGGEIFLYYIGDPTPIIDGANALTNDTNVDNSPQIANGWVVWVSREVTDSVLPGNVMLYAGGTFTKITSSATGVSTPRMSDDAVAWLEPDPDNRRNYFLYRYDFQTKSTSLAPDHIWDDPQSDGPLQVLIKHDGNDREVHIHNNVKGTDKQITNNAVEDSYASISGNVVVWIEGEGEASEIFMAIYTLFSLLKPDCGAALSSQPTFSWEAIGYDDFQIQFSRNENLEGSELLTLPSATPALSQTSYTPTESEWESIAALGSEGVPVYWRVKGTDVQGTESFTDVCQLTVVLAEETEGGSGDSGGDGDSGPTCFISTAAESVSP